MSSMKRLIDENVVERLASHDATLFTDSVEQRQPILQRMGWIGLAARSAARLPQYASIADQLLEEGTTDIVLLGMGGSSLASLVLAEVLGSAEGRPRLHVLDTTSPVEVAGLLDTERGGLSPARTSVLVSSKSGTTIEPLSLYAAFRAWSDEALGKPAAGRRYLVITDPESPLEAFRQREVMRIALPAPANVGGRYSALSAFALAPASFAGMDVHGLVSHAQQADAACQSPAEENPAARLAAWMVDAHAEGRDKLTLVCSPRYASFALWVEQLIAESTGKNGTGIVPISEPGPRSPETYGNDRAVVVVRSSDDASLADWAKTTGETHPLFEIVLGDPLEIATEFVRWEYATAFAGWLLGINPFDEPDVASAKEATQRVLAGEAEVPTALTDIDGVWATYAGGLGGLLARPSELEAALAPVVAALRPGDYLAVLAYLPSGETHVAALRSALSRVSEATGNATTLQIGPRYLHSTGQLHKGGPDTGVFVIVSARDRTDVPVPGQPFSLGRLHRAQAEGDLVTLAERGRRVMRLDLPDSDPATIARVADALVGATRA